MPTNTCPMPLVIFRTSFTLKPLSTIPFNPFTMFVSPATSISAPPNFVAPNIIRALPTAPAKPAIISVTLSNVGPSLRTLFSPLINWFTPSINKPNNPSIGSSPDNADPAPKPPSSFCKADSPEIKPSAIFHAANPAAILKTMSSNGSSCFFNSSVCDLMPASISSSQMLGISRLSDHSILAEAPIFVAFSCLFKIFSSSIPISCPRSFFAASVAPSMEPVASSKLSPSPEPNSQSDGSHSGIEILKKLAIARTPSDKVETSARIHGMTLITIGSKRFPISRDNSVICCRKTRIAFAGLSNVRAKSPIAPVRETPSIMARERRRAFSC